MAHFAQLDDNNVVVNVIVVSNEEMKDEAGNETEARGIQFCVDHFGGRWLQTSYNRSFRKNFAGVGSTYDAQRDAFIPPQPYPSWVLNEVGCAWEPPVAIPLDGKIYNWDEATTSWIES